MLINSLTPSCSLPRPTSQKTKGFQLESPSNIRTFWLKAGQSGHHPSVLKLSFHQLLSCIWGQGSPGTSRGDRLSCCCFDGEVPGAMQLPRLGAMHVHLGWRPLVSLSSWYRQLEQKQKAANTWHGLKNTSELNQQFKRDGREGLLGSGLFFWMCLLFYKWDFIYGKQ